MTEAEAAAAAQMEEETERIAFKDDLLRTRLDILRTKQLQLSEAHSRWRIFASVTAGAGLVGLAYVVLRPLSHFTISFAALSTLLLLAAYALARYSAELEARQAAIWQAGREGEALHRWTENFLSRQRYTARPESAPVRTRRTTPEPPFAVVQEKEQSLR